MTLHAIFFELSKGLSKKIKAPVGTYETLKAHIEQVTKTLELEIFEYDNNPPRWKTRTPPKHISNDVAGAAVFNHNRIIRKFYADLASWSQNPLQEGEDLTPELMGEIWYGLSMLSLPYNRWSQDVYMEEMEALFDVMRGKGRQGIEFEAPPLTAEQAADVINLFSIYFDYADVRLTLPNEYDCLVAGEDVLWCPSHGAWHWDDVLLNDDDEHVCPSPGCGKVL